MSGSTTSLLHAAGDYFETADGRAVFLSGSHTWNDGPQTLGGNPLDYSAYLDFLTAEGGNFTRMWAWSSGNSGFNTSVSPLPWVQTADGRYDLTQLNPTYFSNLQGMVQQAAAKGVYVSVMLFNGGAAGMDGNPAAWATNPFNPANNINGVNGDPNNTGNGLDTYTLDNPAVLAAQEAYVAKVLDTVGNDQNVLFEVANETEGTPADIAWQNAIVDFVHSYQQSHGLLDQPIGITAPSSTGATLSSTQLTQAITASDADWIAPSWDGYANSATPAAGIKPILVDTDHVYGMGGNATWVWQQFTAGDGGTLIMDNLVNTGIAGAEVDNEPDPTSDRLGVTETRQVANLLHLATMTPRGSLSSTGWALADPAGGQYVVTQPNGGGFTVNLSGSAGKLLDVRWMDISTGELTSAGTVTGGSSSQYFSAPTSDPAALVLTPTSTPAPTPTPVAVQGGTFGSGADTLVVTLSEDAWQGDAQADVAIDGTLLTAQPITVTASQSQGQTESFAFKGNFGSGQHTVTVSFLNDAWGGTPSTDRNLYTEGVSLNGVGVSSATTTSGAVTSPAAGTLELHTAGSSASFSASGGTDPTSASLTTSTTAAQLASPGSETVTFAPDQYITAGDVLQYDSNQAWSATAAVEFNGPAPGIGPDLPQGGAEVVFGNTNGAPYQGYELWEDDNGDLRVRIMSNYLAGNYIDVATNTPVAYGQMEFIGATYDGSGKAAGVSIYVDGQKQQTHILSDTLSGSSASNGPMIIGNQLNGWQGQFDLQGQMAEFSLSDVDRPASYFASSAQNGSFAIDANTQLAYNFSQGGGLSVSDLSGHGNNGMLSSATMWTQGS